MTLQQTTRFSSSYASDDDENHAEASRFMDGTASITAVELQHELPNWTDEQPDFPDMVRCFLQ